MERVDRMPAESMRVDLSVRAVHLLGDMGGLLLVRGCRVRWLRPALLGVRDVRLQLVVPLGRGML